jgi:hypothetical protein
VQEEDELASGWISREEPLMIDMIYAFVTSNNNRPELSNNFIEGSI